MAFCRPVESIWSLVDRARHPETRARAVLAIFLSILQHSLMSSRRIVEFS
jgi:hypothetical protein